MKGESLFLISYAMKFSEASYAEILAWQQGTETRLSKDEFESIYRLTSQYHSFRSKYSNTRDHAPYKAYLGKKAIKTVAQHGIDAMFEKFKAMKRIRERENG